jgi:hypothetical protein
MDTTKVLGKSIPFIVGDKTYLLSPLTYNDQAAFELFLRKRALVALEQMRPVLPETEYDKRFNDLLDRFAAGEYAFGGKLSAKAAVTVDGVKQLFYLAAKQNHPDITQETVDQIFEAKAKEAAATLGAVNADPLLQPPEAPANL